MSVQCPYRLEISRNASHDYYRLRIADVVVVKYDEKTSNRETIIFIEA